MGVFHNQARVSERDVALRKVPERIDAARDKPVRRGVRDFLGRAQYGRVHAVLLAVGFKMADVTHREPRDHRADNGRVDVKNRGEPKPCVDKADMVGQRPPQIPGADESGKRLVKPRIRWIFRTQSDTL